MDSIPTNHLNKLTPKATLLNIRIVWAAMLSAQVMFLIIIQFIWSSNPIQQTSPDLVQLLFILNIGMLATVIPIGYFIRSQTYKRGWQARVVTPKAYFTGNIILLALCEGASLFGLVITLLNGSLWPTIIPSVIAMGVQAINFPNGLAMQDNNPSIADLDDGRSP